MRLRIGIRSGGTLCLRPSHTTLVGERKQDGYGDQARQCHAGDQTECALQGVRVEITIVAVLDVHERPHGDPPGN